MTREKARIVILEYEFQQARRLVEFLHNCLVHPDNNEMKGGCSYEYPEETIRRLEEWELLCPNSDLKSCHHSKNDDNCESCRQRYQQRKLVQEAKEVLES